MNQNKSCPECNKILVRSVNQCRCGWKTEEKIEIDHRCACSISGQRCPLNGSINFSTHGGAPWYCSEHLRNLHDEKRCYEILMHALEHFEEIMESRIDWKVKLFPEDYAVKRQHVQRLKHSLKI